MTTTIRAIAGVSALLLCPSPARFVPVGVSRKISAPHAVSIEKTTITYCGTLTRDTMAAPPTSSA